MTGTSGFSGISGFSGRSGFSGTNGGVGATGATGTSGFSGFSGTSGFSGLTGPIAGSNTQIVFNDSGVANGSSNLTFNKATSLLTVTGPVTVASTNSLTVRTITTGANSTDGTVTGNWTLTGGSRWQSTYADLAERYEADDLYEPGTVVELGGEKEVTISKEKGSRKVVGVITTDPAYIMNTGLSGNNVVEVALIGRVPCKVVGDVTKGDLLITSNTHGYACANNEPMVGTVIGKALESFNGLHGIIEIIIGKC